MAKTLYIVRHSQASWQQNEVDFDRSLTETGKMEAKWVSQKLKEAGIVPDIWISSSAKRAHETLEIFHENLVDFSPKIELKQELYHADVQTLLKTVEKIDNSYNSAIIFGHNPGLQEFIEYLSNVYIVDVATSTFYEIEFQNADQWMEISEGTGEIKQVIAPQLID